ncbi:hypothetical protein AN7084.2 [Aspergillus nidulans FGSC A4]|uniref:PKS-like enzyme, putative (JCVI) n=1 Tax=Emericella nidulans (strain FGSC A4 / ATCC 38163 / CBS 112.46 / NRRL 194 / M139) TaxID=227321 RepID=Q5AX96_EMENI|nr:hypothetical protein [Aspergillus nidulans FGSC A4]EAA61213.1 hypothetical protein AN7084.2 [Aspergillus nidulans FGSC A4]CBF79115.1 TPA: PKS-like enzyme, putative (JCVI) [Aspergillus nidulans FGSC A4]|eukprot:XP_664688.1 hypothetical protein AN7084.2 [Aspergillus nidulans FGSC A4]
MALTGCRTRRVRWTPNAHLVNWSATFGTLWSINTGAYQCGRYIVRWIAALGRLLISLPSPQNDLVDICLVSIGAVYYLFKMNGITSTSLPSPRYHFEPIAVIGFACRLPGNNNSPTALWDFLERGGVASRAVPASRFNLAGHENGSKRPGTMRTPGGMFLESINPADIDAQFFGLSRAEATAMDPQQRQLLEVVYEGLENAGITLEQLRGQDVGCFVGSYASDYGDIQARNPDDRAPNSTVGIGRAMLSNRLSHFLDIKGPSMTIDTACSGSLVSLDVATRYLQTGEIRAAIVAACNLYMSPEHCIDISSSIINAASLTGLCHTFDAKADGYVKAEAVNMVIIKRLQDAIRDRDPIRSIIRGSASNSDGWTAGIASPSSEGQAAVTRQAYRIAGIADFNATSYVECHGTGTRAGDPIEVKGVASVFCPERPAERPLLIGSVKSNIGHSEPGAGISGLLKTILALEKSVIPGNPTFETPNPEIDFDGLKTRAFQHATPWPSMPFKRASVNSFGYGGSNAHVILDEAKTGVSASEMCFKSSYLPEDHDPFEECEENEKCFPQLLVFSANDEKSLQEYIRALRAHLINPRVRISLQDLAYTLSERRSRHFNRAFLITQTSLNLDLHGLVFGKLRSSSPRVGFIFTGQGSQWPQMGKSLLDMFPSGRGQLARLDRALQLLPDPPEWSLYGAGHHVLEELLQAHRDSIAVACINSPESVTLSGPLNVLKTANMVIQEKGYFARLLQVNMAYHNPMFMTDITAQYKQMLHGLGLDSMSSPVSKATKEQRTVKMFSSVTGLETMGPCNVEYWCSNMQYPVQFNQAVRMMLSDEKQPINFLIELGPSGALASPTKQIIQSMRDKKPDLAIEYHAAYKRDVVTAAMGLFEVAGHLYLSGGAVDIEQVNSHHAHREKDQHQPSVIVDLPNYAWNHSIKYWYESQSSRDWRFRHYPNHDLLGSKILGTSWFAPSFKKVLRLADLPWLRDHRVAGQPLFPAAGYIAMAVEAAYQTGQRSGMIDTGLKVSQVPYRFRNIKFVRALVLDEAAPSTLMLSMSPERGWYKFSVYTADGESVPTIHCEGLVSLHVEVGKAPPSSAFKQLLYPTPARLWYKAMDKVGYNFGSAFQTQLQIESVVGTRQNRALVSFLEPQSAYAQSLYSIHPAVLDGCLQSGAPALWNGVRSAVRECLVPAIIEDLVISARQTAARSGASVCSAEYSGVGSRDEPCSYKSNIIVSDPATGDTLIRVRGLAYSALDREEAFSQFTPSMRLEWKPDISFLSRNQLYRILDTCDTRFAPYSAHDDSRALSFISLLLHKKPALRVVEFNIAPSTDSSFFAILGHIPFTAKGAVEYHFVSNNAAALVAFQGMADGCGLPNVQLSALDVSRLDIDSHLLGDKADLAVLNTDHQICGEKLHNAIVNIAAILRKGGFILILAHQSSTNQVQARPWDGHSASINDALGRHGFKKSVAFDMGTETHAIVGQLLLPVREPSAELQVSLVLLSSSTDSALASQMLAESGVTVAGIHYLPLGEIRKDLIILITDEMFKPVLAEVTQEQWGAIQRILAFGCKIVWVTSGAQKDVVSPLQALVSGLSRVVRAEDPTISFTLLDVESPYSKKSFRAIADVLERVDNGNTSSGLVDEEYEYVERGGIVHVSRVYPDIASGGDGKAVIQNLHNHASCVRLTCQAPGFLESLQFTETGPSEAVVPDGFVEVEMHAAGLNYKDVATVLGIVPENQYLLGLEGAGVIRRIRHHAGDSPFYIGQRVAICRRGSFANRVQCPIEGIHAIPDWMSFEEAATIPIVYQAALYSLVDLANVQWGQSVLIHSAAGGLGIAAIQLCQYLGAEIYATVGSDEKREFLIREFNLSPDRLFSSRDTVFASCIIEQTGGRGVDVILNTLTGSLLDESWRIIAAHGTMVELGKKDILDRNSLSMEPFNRNASYRAFDLSHPSITRPLVARLLKRIFDLIHGGHIRPIAPRTVYAYSNIAAAIRYMRGGAHIGKIIISRDAPQNCTDVPVMPVQKSLKLRGDVSYLIVGGLKGLCGSLATYLACHGAKHISVMSRSDYTDDKSKAVLRDLTLLGVNCSLVRGDVSVKDDVQKAFCKGSRPPVAGVIHGAMVLKDTIYTSMTAAQFHDALRCKVQGTYNLHDVALQLGLDLDFFTLLSSLSGLVGHKGQANYAAASAFLDSFALYRRSKGLAACSVDLGIIDDIGYMAEHESITDRLDTETWIPLNEVQLHRILYTSILQERDQRSTGTSQLITGIAYPAPAVPSALYQDARFTALCQKSANSNSASISIKGGARDMQVQALLTLVQAKADAAVQIAAMIDAANAHFMRSLALSEPMEAAKPLVLYGLDSLAAVEFRNWARRELNVVVSTLDVLGAKTLNALCEMMVGRLAG